MEETGREGVALHAHVLRSILMKCHRVYIYLHIHLYTCTHMYVYVYIHICICIRECVCIYIYIIYTYRVVRGARRGWQAHLLAARACVPPTDWMRGSGCGRKCAGISSPSFPVALLSTSFFARSIVQTFVV